MKKANNFQIAKVQPQGCCLAFALFFCQFQPGLAYKKAAYKKAAYKKACSSV